MAHDDKATAAQLKHDIDSGLTHDKVRHFDPAVAPLGTDEEAAGTPTPGDALMREREQQRNLAGFDKDGRPQSSAPRAFGWPMLLLFAAIALGVLLSFLGH